MRILFLINLLLTHKKWLKNIRAILIWKIVGAIIIFLFRVGRINWKAYFPLMGFQLNTHRSRHTINWFYNPRNWEGVTQVVNCCWFPLLPSFWAPWPRCFITIGFLYWIASFPSTVTQVVNWCWFPAYSLTSERSDPGVLLLLVSSK